MTSEDRETEIRRRLAMPYHRLGSGEPVEGYLGEVLELPGCLTAGDTPQEALANLDDAMAGWIETCLVDDRPIPEPGSVKLQAV